MKMQSLVLAGVMSLSSLLSAQQPETAAPEHKVESAKTTKPSEKPAMYVAVVDLQKIMNDTKIDREYSAEFSKLQQKLQKELEELGKEIKADEEQLKAQATTLTPEALQKKREAFEEKNQKAQLQLQRANQQLQQKEFEIRNKLAQEVRTYSQQLVDRDGTISMIFDSNMALAHAKSIDVTDKLSSLIKTDIAKKEAAKKEAAPKNGNGKNGKAAAA